MISADSLVLSPGIIVLRLSVFLLFLPDAIHSKPSVFTKLRFALWTGVYDVLKTIQYKWYPHTAVTSAIKVRDETVGFAVTYV